MNKFGTSAGLMILRAGSSTASTFDSSLSCRPEESECRRRERAGRENAAEAPDGAGRGRQVNARGGGCLTASPAAQGHGGRAGDVPGHSWGKHLAQATRGHAEGATAGTPAVLRAPGSAPWACARVLAAHLFLDDYRVALNDVVIRLVHHLDLKGLIGGGYGHLHHAVAHTRRDEHGTRQERLNHPVAETGGARRRRSAERTRDRRPRSSETETARVGRAREIPHVARGRGGRRLASARVSRCFRQQGPMPRAPW